MPLPPQMVQVDIGVEEKDAFSVLGIAHRDPETILKNAELNR
ncbi:MAG: hypothetical protein ACPHAS_07145 [Synechococcus sp.]